MKTNSAKRLIVWQRFCEPARLRIAYCLSVCLFVCLFLSCLTSHANKERGFLSTTYSSVHLYLSLMYPFGRQAVR